MKGPPSTKKAKFRENPFPALALTSLSNLLKVSPFKPNVLVDVSQSDKWFFVCPSPQLNKLPPLSLRGSRVNLWVSQRWHCCNRPLCTMTWVGSKLIESIMERKSEKPIRVTSVTGTLLELFLIHTELNTALMIWTPFTHEETDSELNSLFQII